VARRIPALILLGLALVFCVALAASESLTNRTGRSATAVTVTFSEQVRMTSYDESVFPTKEPASRSESFRFSGGQIESGARFAVSWTPSTAEITGTEWETTSASAAGGSAGASTPQTYEQIMAQIAQYPGPDEPLYVPAEDEQIWLTDLEGHADIYDNDSIKINYSQGFDKSQITRIDVYRNGVKMRFLPALFDVLTNEQMKTFDGNPAENTPKSEHTDHAIAGYTYILRLAGLPSNNELTTTVRNPIAFGGERLAFPSHNIPGMWNNLQDDELLREMQALKAQGFTGLSVTESIFMASPRSSTIFRQYVEDPAVCDSYKRSWTDAEISRIVGVAKRAGLIAVLEIVLWETNAYGGMTGGRVAPDDVGAWFRAYGDVCVELAAVAQSSGVDVLCVGAEINPMQRYGDQWRALVGRVRQVFTGRVTYAEADHYLIYPEAYPKWMWDAKEESRFWDCFDLIGLNCWTVPVAADKDPRTSEMLAEFVAFWRAEIDYYRQAYPDKPIVFMEIGTRNFDGAALADEHFWDASMTSMRLDQQEYSDQWYTYVAGAAALELDGFCVFSVELDPAVRRPSAGMFHVSGTPAMRVIESFFVGN